VDRLIEQNPLPQSPDHVCPYLPDRTARSEGFVVNEIEPEVYAAFVDQGFRRSGSLIYRPTCRSCRECVPIRVRVGAFRMSRSMRRVWRRNQDLRVEVGRPEFTEKKHAIYDRYLRHQHDGTMTGSREEFTDFLCVSPVDTIEFRFLLGNRLVGVSVADRCPGLLSSIYMYFDPDFGKRSLGTYSILWEIRYCREHGWPYYYLGYYVAGCSKMSYKADFKPADVLLASGDWVPADDAPGSADRPAQTDLPSDCAEEQAD
jgi:arginine-tRNA-protein transferase